MSDWHALEQSALGNRLTLVVHTAVPNTNNDASPTPVNHRTAAVEYQTAKLGGTTSQVIGLSTGEQDQLDGGELVETTMSVDFNANHTPAQRHTAVGLAATAEQAKVGGNMSNILQYWGGSG